MEFWKNEEQRSLRSLLRTMQCGIIMSKLLWIR